MFKQTLLAAFAIGAMATGASAATLSGTFSVTAVNAENLTSAQSRALIENAEAAYYAEDGGILVNPRDEFTYEGLLDFGTTDGTDATTIADWLASGTGTVTGLDTDFGDLQLSKPSINNGTATTTFFLFETILNMVGDFTIRHDDGVQVADDGVVIGGTPGPNSVRTTIVTGFNGGEFSLLYVATNGDPSILKVDGDLAPIPLPASLPLLLAGMGGLALMRRKRS